MVRLETTIELAFTVDRDSPPATIEQLLDDCVAAVAAVLEGKVFGATVTVDLDYLVVEPPPA